MDAPIAMKPTVIGLYGVPGSGKTFLLKQLEQELGKQNFDFHEGSQVIATFVPGGLGAFHGLDEQEKVHRRQLAIVSIADSCRESGRVAVVAGHFMFWPEEDGTGRQVCTRNDLDVYTHIIYLDVAADVVIERRGADTERSRPLVSTEHLRKWQLAEMTELRRLCRENGILFSAVACTHSSPLDKVTKLVLDFQQHSTGRNLCLAETRLDSVLASLPDPSRLETVLVLDADGTLAAVDTGALFWNTFADKSGSVGAEREASPLKTLFSSPLGYTYTAFRQAMLLYEESADEQEYDAICEAVASQVAIHPDFILLLQLASRQEHVAAVVISCGLRLLWEKALQKAHISTVKVIAGGRIADGFVVTAEVKAAMVRRLRDVYNKYVFAFGDSVLDLPMLREAQQAIVVVGEQQMRSKSMEDALKRAIEVDGLRARQVMLPDHAQPRLDTTQLPVLRLTEREFLASILRSRSHQMLHATDRNAAKLLMTPTRDARIAGPLLREAHRRVGWYLAVEFLADIVGAEEYPIPHVQGHHTIGHRLCHEQHTSIVALMRGGEPMALGISDAFPLAMFIHAKVPDDVKLQHLEAQRTVLLVDSVVNSGKTVMEFIQQIRRLHGTIRIVVVAGVVQSQSVNEGSLVEILGHDTNVSIVSLRVSNNKFTGRGATDTGNRLFGSVHLE